MKPILTITIPQFLLRVEVSKSRRPQYYKNSEANNVPKKYQPVQRHKDGKLRGKDGNKILRNPRSVGKPSYIKLAGNSFSSGFGSPHTRSMLVNELKADFKKKIKNNSGNPRPIPEDAYPVRIEWEMHTDVGSLNYDLSNFWFYYKYLEDTLVSMGIFRDDSIAYITALSGPKLIPVDSIDKRKIVLKVYKETRKQIIHNEAWL